MIKTEYAVLLRSTVATCKKVPHRRKFDAKGWHLRTFRFTTKL